MGCWAETVHFQAYLGGFCEMRSWDCALSDTCRKIWWNLELRLHFQRLFRGFWGNAEFRWCTFSDFFEMLSWVCALPEDFVEMSWDDIVLPGVCYEFKYKILGVDCWIRYVILKGWTRMWSLNDMHFQVHNRDWMAMLSQDKVYRLNIDLNEGWRWSARYIQVQFRINAGVVRETVTI